MVRFPSSEDPKLPSPGLHRWLHLLGPGNVSSELRRVASKVVRKVTKPDLRTVTLPARGERRGRALVSYIIDGLLTPPDRPLPHGHTHYWESRQIALTFAELGFETDVIHWTNDRFAPRGGYDAFLDVRVNLERLAPLVGDGCLKIQHLETAHYRFHNPAQLRRLEQLEKRRGFRIRPQKLIEENRAIETADCAVTVGNDFTAGTYAYAGRPIHRVPISAPFLYDSPENRDFQAARRRFIWFGSGGLVHKGLDLVLDAFAGLPDHELVVCGPIERERDFAAAYARELYATPNIRTMGWVDVATEAFRRLLDSTLAAVYPSCSEGGGGAVITLQHGGLIPLVTPEASVDVGDFGRNLPTDPSVDAIRDAVVALSDTPIPTLREMSLAAWEQARAVHTRERFAATYREVVAKLVA